MNPKEEIQKLIQVEMEKWKDYKIKNENFLIHQVDNFQSFRALLNDLVASIEPEYIKVNILDDRATIEVSNETKCLSCISWDIQPNFNIQKAKEEYWDTNLWQKKVNVEAQPGFIVKEKRGDGEETNSEFGTENEIINYLAREIAKRVAYYRYKKSV